MNHFTRTSPPIQRPPGHPGQIHQGLNAVDSNETHQKRVERIAFLAAERRVAEPRRSLLTLLEENPALNRHEATLMTPPESYPMTRTIGVRFSRENRPVSDDRHIRGISLENAIHKVANDIILTQPPQEWYVLCGKDSDIGLIRMATPPSEDALSLLCDFDREIIFIGG